MPLFIYLSPTSLDVIVFCTFALSVVLQRSCLSCFCGKSRLRGERFKCHATSSRLVENFAIPALITLIFNPEFLSMTTEHQLLFCNGRNTLINSINHFKTFRVILCRVVCACMQRPMRFCVIFIKCLSTAFFNIFLSPVCVRSSLTGLVEISVDK